MLDEPPATSCLSPTLKDTEQQTLRRYFQFIGVSFTDISARLPFWRHRAAGASAQVWQGMAQMHGPALDGRARDTDKSPEHIVLRREIHWRPTCRDALPTEGDEKMRASKLITISTLAVLMGGTSLAIGQAGSPSVQGSGSM